MFSLLRELHYPSDEVTMVTLAVLVVTGCWTASTRGVLPVLAMFAAAGLWLLTNTNLEGHVLLTVLPRHGMTSADLAAPVVVGAALLSRLIGRYRSTEDA